MDKERPAYGGTCYSTMTVGQTVPVSKYGNDSFTAMGSFIATKAEDHVFGHVMDGYKVGAVPGENVRISFPLTPLSLFPLPLAIYHSHRRVPQLTRLP